MHLVWGQQCCVSRKRKMARSVFRFFTENSVAVSVAVPVEFFLRKPETKNKKKIENNREKHQCVGRFRSFFWQANRQTDKKQTSVGGFRSGKTEKKGVRGGKPKTPYGFRFSFLVSVSPYTAEAAAAAAAAAVVCVNH